MTTIYRDMAAALSGAVDPSDDVTDVMMEAFAASEIDEVSYLLKLEEFLSERGIYAFEGWEDAVLYGSPKIERFWIVTDWLLSDTRAFGAVPRIEKDGRAKVLVAKKKEAFLVRIKVHRQVLDEIERKNRKEAEEEAEAIAAEPAIEPNPNQIEGGGLGT